jgi:Tfp pilus assembly protein PilN
MKRMNLLPPEVRPRDAGRRGKRADDGVGAAAAVLAMLVYAFVISGVREDENDLTQLKDETQQAQARADALSPYGEFANMKDSRERSVRTVALTRFDYERLTRELTRILPGGVWVSHLDVAPTEPTAEAVDAGADSPDAAQDTPPAMKVSGCAPSQDIVADTLDRLRALTGATDIALGSSSAGDATEVGADSPRLVSGPGSGGCGTDGRPRVAFDATVVLTTPIPEGLATTPATATTTTGAGS